MIGKFLFVAVLGLSVCGCSTPPAGALGGTGETPPAVNSDADVGPKLEQVKDPNPYANYKQAMASDAAHPMAYEWQTANESQVAVTTQPEILATFVTGEAAALRLLARVKGAYATDPLVATQVAAVTQLVMTPGCPKAAAGRPIWVAALEKTRAAAKDDYVRAFCDQQLRLCR